MKVVCYEFNISRKYPSVYVWLTTQITEYIYIYTYVCVYVCVCVCVWRERENERERSYEVGITMLVLVWFFSSMIYLTS